MIFQFLFKMTFRIFVPFKVCDLFYASGVAYANLTQHVNFPTHQAGHTLDLIITTKDSTLSPTITHSLVSPSDHFPIFTSIVISPPSPPPLTKHFFRCIKSINLNNFVLSLQILGSLLLFKNSNLLVVTLKKSGLGLTLLLT